MAAMTQFQFTTSGKMNIKLRGLRFGKILQTPEHNVKSWAFNPQELTLHAQDMDDFTGWGAVELLDVPPVGGKITVSITSDTLGWFGTAQIAIFYNGQCVLNDNFQSGVYGPVGDPEKIKIYPINTGSLEMLRSL